MGNEKVDELVREGLSTSFIGLEPEWAISKQASRTMIKNWFRKTYLGVLRDRKL